MKILMVTPMPPQSHAPGAIPLHQITLVTIAGLEPGEQQAINKLRAVGLDVLAILRTEPQGWQKWQRRWSLASMWLGGKIPWRTVWFWDSGVQQILDYLLAEKTFDLVIVEDNAMGIYTYRTTIPLIFTEHEVRRQRPIDKVGLGKSDLLHWMANEIDWARWPSYQRAVWRKFDRIQAFTERDAQAI